VGYTFPVGTVVVKLLFTTATVAEVPYLEGAPEWLADVHAFDAGEPYGCPLFLRDSDVPTHEATRRESRPVRLLQVDLAVRDGREYVEAATGWVFGTFAYRAGTGDPSCTHACWWNLVPIGLMWGNGEGVTPAIATATPGLLTEQRLNLTPIPAPAVRLGWAGRLNGPVDNPLSACLSCHSTAQYKSALMMPPSGSSDTQRLNWFRNIKPGQAFDPTPRGSPPATPVSMDYSLQLAISVRSWNLANAAERGFVFTPEEAIAQFGPDIIRPGPDEEPGRER
jgi:hypothetical protein